MHSDMVEEMLEDQNGNDLLNNTDSTVNSTLGRRVPDFERSNRSLINRSILDPLESDNFFDEDLFSNEDPLECCVLELGSINSRFDTLCCQEDRRLQVLRDHYCKNVEDERQNRVAEANRVEKLKRRNAELRAIEAQLQQEVAGEERKQTALNKPVLERGRKTKLRLKQAKDVFKNWTKLEEKNGEKMQKAALEKENTIKLLDRLGVSLTKSTEGGGNVDFDGLTFKGIDPLNPNAEYTVLFTDFDATSWTFRAIGSDPKFPEFEDLAKKYNEDKQLVPFIYGLRKHWSALVEAKRRMSTSIEMSSPSTD